MSTTILSPSSHSESESEFLESVHMRSGRSPVSSASMTKLDFHTRDTCHLSSSSNTLDFSMCNQ
ncbi:hypothetical protein PILCRDRAFT_651497 [Piloderma croceum F 1598]|uniref:Uncharacterized protein n=1 Tax=Piloderma croceum (strain F 1598) TaxID=765440 RepID=A0A0C3BG47_PILCF|nr:hypothetical protein PILCRDRAFT_651497 [Piloderma croceum F 1598]